MSNKNGKLTKKVKKIQEECDKEEESLKKKSPKSEKITPEKKKIISPEVDECRVDNDCESKCCLDNQCVDGKICKEIKEKIQMEEKMKKIDKINKDLREKEKKETIERINKLKDLDTNLTNFRIMIDETPKNLEKRREKMINKVETELEKLKQEFYTDKNEENLYSRLQKNLKRFKMIKKEEPKKEEVKKEQPKKEEPKKEEVKKEQPKKEEVKKEQPKKEEVKKEQPKKEEPKKEEVKKQKSQKISNLELSKIKDDIKSNKLLKEDYENILKKLNLKTQKEYLKELLIIGLENL